MTKLEAILQTPSNNPPQDEFVTSPVRYVQFWSGPGAGGTSGLIKRALLLTLAAQDAVGPVVARGFFGMWEQKQLYNTTMADFKRLLDEAGIKYRERFQQSFLWVPDLKLEVFWGETVDPEQIVNYELSWAAIEQAEKRTPFKSFQKMDDRLRFQAKDASGKNLTFHSLMVKNNAIPKGHWLEKLPGMGGHVVHATPFDNQDNLPASYFERFNHMDKETALEVIEGELSALGARIYRGAQRSKHTDRGLAPVPGFPLLRAWDYGQHACLVCQKPGERLLCLKEFMGDPQGETLRLFKSEVVKWCRDAWGSRFQFKDWQDPAGNAKDVTRTIRARDVMESGPVRVPVRDADNSIFKGHEIIRDLMQSTDSAGVPLIIADEEGCPMLIEGWTYGYVVGGHGTEGKSTYDIPEDNVYKHLQDCLRYIVNMNFKLKLKFQDPVKAAEEEDERRRQRAMSPGQAAIGRLMAGVGKKRKLVAV